MFACPICSGKIKRVCQCRKAECICENDHIFHHKLVFEKGVISRKEIHLGAANHFTDNCVNCEIIK